MIKEIFYRDLLSINVIDNNEEFVSIKQIGLMGKYLEGMRDMEGLFAGDIMVRKSVGEKLCKADSILKKNYPQYRLFVTYGYRSLEVQTQRFLKRLQNVSGEEFIENPLELYEKVHTSVAVPSVAGHPTGGAVDILIINKRTGLPLDFGTKIYDYTVTGHDRTTTNISLEAKNNRNILQACMMEAGFAPYIGEYRHFSYGDKEWAAYYGEDSAIYEQKLVKEIVFMKFF